MKGVSVGSFQACALHQSGKLACWGSAFGGGLDHPAGVFTSVAVGNRPCALDTAGKAHCWGKKSAELKGAFVALAAGDAHSCGLRADGSLRCIEADGFLAGRSDPTPPAALRMRALFAGYEHMCGLDAAGKAHCWGRDVQGETSAPSDVVFDRLGLREKRSCGLTRAGAIRCWGGSPAAAPKGPFVDVALIGNTASDRPAYVCGIRKSDASVACWAY